MQSLCNLGILLFSLLLLFFLGKVGWNLYETARGERILRQQWENYRPADTGEVDIEGMKPLRAPAVSTSEDNADTQTITPPENAQETPKQDSPLVRLQKEYPDVCGWISLDGTNIDNLYVRGKDYDRYLRRDLDGNYLTQGTLFLDPHCTTDFSSFNTILYGHNMRAGTMFGDLDLFAESAYFEAHSTGRVYLPTKTYGLQIFALLVVKSDDTEIYNPYVNTLAERENFLAYLKQNARQYREIGVAASDTFLTMSTCAYEFDKEIAAPRRQAGNRFFRRRCLRQKSPGHLRLFQTGRPYRPVWLLPCRQLYGQGRTAKRKLHLRNRRLPVCGDAEKIGGYRGV